MSASILCAILAWMPLPPVQWDALEKDGAFAWAAPLIAGWETVITRDGIPVTVEGREPLPGWGSYDTVTVSTPLEAGVWASGRWEMDFSSRSVPDSSFSSEIGLIENTEGANRYSAGLRRPLFSMLDLDLNLARDDTTGDQRFVVRMDALETGGRGWQGEEDGYVLWSGVGFPSAIARISFGHFRSGGRYWELAGQYGISLDALELVAGAAASVEDDSVYSVQGHIRTEIPLAGMKIVLRADAESDDGELQAGGTAGLIAGLRGLRLQAGVAAEPGGKAGLIGAAGFGPLDGFLQVREGANGGGLQVSLSRRIGLLHAGAFLLSDTLRFSGTVMPAIHWGGEGMLYGGISWEVTDHDTTTSGTMDVRSMFTLGSFAFIFAVEDVLDQWRSYSFGITWAFNDRRHRTEEEVER